MTFAAGDSLEPAAEDEAAWTDAALVVALFAVSPVGALWLRGPAGPVRDTLTRWLRSLLPANDPWLTLPSHVTEDRLLGGLALAETLSTGHAVFEQGVLGRADGGVILVPLAERTGSRVASHLSAMLDRGCVTVERDGLGAEVTCRAACILLDEGLDDEAPPPGLQERALARLDLRRLSKGPTSRALVDLSPSPLPHPVERSSIAHARALRPRVTTSDEAVGALCQAAVALGIPSLRAPLAAARLARSHAALMGRSVVEIEDLEVAARLALGWRATRIPETEADEPPEDSEPPPSDTPEDRDDREEESTSAPTLDDVLVAAVKSGLASGLLDSLRVQSPVGAPTAGQAGAMQRSLVGGRPAGTLAKRPGPGERLNVVETLRAAAPWQVLRGGGPGARLRVYPSDFRAQQFRQPTETSVIFAVDASGSAAAKRLAEAKGAVEQVLKDCYARRDQVALVAFRNNDAELLVPPTRSLARARRCLSAMAGGGPTPLARGIEAARRLALEARRRGRTPLIVVMTDGRANISLDGEPDPAAAMEDALTVAAQVRRDDIATIFLDTAPRPRPRAKTIAEAMAARYLPLPYLDAKGISDEVRGLAAGVRPSR